MEELLAGVTLACAAVFAVLFLAWFGNYTAKMYRELFGSIQKPPQIPNRPIVERSLREPEHYECMTVMASCMPSVSYYMASMVGDCSMVSYVRPGGIIRMK